MTATTVHEAFEDQARRTPDATALWSAGHPTSYAALDAAATRIAVRLHGLGARRGELVAVHLERGVDQVAAVLGVLKAGAGFVMLDTTFPTARLQSQIAETTPVVVVSHRLLAAGLGDLDVPIMPVEDHPPASGSGTGPDLADVSRARPDDLACVMFTSGSTGRPKAVAGNHRSLLISVSTASFGRFGSGETVVQAAPVSWDAFVLELFGALLFGGAVVLQPGQSPDPAVIADLVARHRVTTLFASASLLCYLIDEHPGVFAHLDRVLTGGDTASPVHLARLLRRHPDLRLANGYGPVETMIAATTHEVSVADTDGGSIPIGRDTLGKQVEILDADLRPVPPGQTGELYISGAGLADGYLQQASTTATRFVARPGGTPGERMYRTGDLGRRRADGVVEYLGRRDAQIKLRGFRIELGEIETALTRHPSVSRAAATVHKTASGDRLVGYVVPAAGGAVAVGELRDHLATILPRHAVPTQVVVLAELPTTTNGKLDRRALRLPELATTSPRPASDDDERVLCGLFAELLDVPDVGVDDDFFALGGHSLLAARLVNRVRTQLGRELDLRAVFAAPTVTRLARALGTAPTSRPSLTAQERPAVLPLSFGQERMWFDDQTASARAASHVGRTFDLRGALDAAALGLALTDVVSRHEALRTVFPVGPTGQPHQQVLDVDRIELRLDPVRLDPAELDGAVEDLMRRDFDLASDLPLRVRLFSLGPEHAVLALVLHHIACDGWSMAPLLGDLATCYAARCHGVAPELPPLPVQYADFAAWQRCTLHGSALEPALRHWTAVLDDLPEASGLPAARPRPAGRGGRGGRGRLVPVIIEPELHRSVLDLARDSTSTVFMIIHAALALLLSRLGAGPDQAIGTPVAGRSDEALDQLIGFFVNTVVLRTDTSGDPSVRTLLARVRDADLDAYAHGEVPIERVVEAVKPDRRPDRHPLFQVMLAVRDQEPRLELPGIETTTAILHSGEAQFELTVDLVEQHDGDGRPAGLRGDLEYATDLYDHAFAETLAERLPRVLRAMVADPETTVSRIDVLSDHERARLTHDWRGPADPAPVGCLHDLVAEQVARTPDAPAIVAGEHRLSYGELDRRAEGLARALRSAGVGPDTIVAVALPRSADLVVALLAVLKAGGAFLVVDPSEPDPRTLAMLTEAGPVCAVVSLDPPSLPPGLPRIPVTADRGAAGSTVERPTSQPDDAAYVVFTSGSTGAPKGVVVPHRAIVTCLLANRRWDPLSPDDRVLFKAAVTFDVAIREVFWPLVQGATIVAAAPGGQRDPVYLADLVRREAITTIDFVPSMLPAFLDLDLSSGTTLRRITCGGEALPPALARRCHDVLGIEVQNFYGPTEAAVEVTTWRWSPDEADDAGSVPIGRPGINTGVLVLDEGLEPAPVGTIGELYLSGAQLARGYLGRPGLTAERFVADPYGPPGARLYRTGDRGRWRPDGVLEFAGRDDGQVKVNGRRIELGEIETVLRRHPAVADGVVTDSDHRPGDVRLTAYAVPRAGAALTPAELRDHLAKALPRPLVPAVVVLDALPLTRHGKLDRAALPAATAVRTTHHREPVSPQERVLCRLFAKVLGATDVGADDSFFDLGGHSLLATRLISQARAALGVEIDIAALFEFPTAAGLAAHLTDSPPARPALRPRPTAEEYSR
ncbi:MAG TPA: amino acid adenylation domain-containing protein [Microlunatus sp.]